MDPEPSKAERSAFLPGAVGTVRVFGVPIRLHFTFLLLFIFLIVYGIGEQQSAMINVAFVGALFGSVILHELGHAVIGRHYGVRTLEIVMFPIGGVARLERSPKPGEEFWIALAGPLVNLLLSGGLLALLFWRGRFLPLTDILQPTAGNLVERIALGNLLMAAFNLLPAFPMDGGRILRAVLAFRRPVERATELAAKAGQFLAIGIGLWGLLTANYMLIFIAFFVYLGAAQEGAAALGRMLTRGLPVRAAMVTDFRTLSHGDTIRDAAALLLATTQQDFPVLHGDRVIGLLGRNALLKAMASGGPESYVASAMERNFARVSPEQDLSEAMPAFTRAGSCALVMDGETLLGLLTAENLSEFLLLRRFGLAAEDRKPER